MHRPMRKATVPSKAFVIQVEETAARPPSGSESRIHSMDSFICGIVRFQLGTSARFSDLQHTNPDTLKVTSTTVELAAWQTKTHSAVVVKKKPVPLICPKYSISGKDWWTPLITTWRKLAATPMFEGMDYLIPAVGKDYDGFIARPASSERALNWLRGFGSPRTPEGPLGGPYVTFLPCLHAGLRISSPDPNKSAPVLGQLDG